MGMIDWWALEQGRGDPLQQGNKLNDVRNNAGRMSGADVHRIRKLVGLTEGQFARALNVDLLIVLEWESGQAVVTEEWARSIREVARRRVGSG